MPLVCCALGLVRSGAPQMGKTITTLFPAVSTSFWTTYLLGQRTELGSQRSDWCESTQPHGSHSTGNRWSVDVAVTPLRCLCFPVTFPRLRRGKRAGKVTGPASPSPQPRRDDVEQIIQIQITARGITVMCQLLVTIWR